MEKLFPPIPGTKSEVRTDDSNHFAMAKYQKRAHTQRSLIATASGVVLREEKCLNNGSHRNRQDDTPSGSKSDTASADLRRLLQSRPYLRYSGTPIWLERQQTESNGTKKSTAAIF